MFGLSNTFMWVAGFALSAALVNSLGILAIIRYREWAEKSKSYFMCFAAGILVSTPLPPSIEHSSQRQGCLPETIAN